MWNGKAHTAEEDHVIRSKARQTLNGPCIAVVLLRNRIISFQTGSSRKKSKSPDAFQISFPMRTNYMYGRFKRTLLQEIFALTLCLWMKSGVGPSLGTPFSYSAPGQANELVLIEWGNNPLELLVDDKVRDTHRKHIFVVMMSHNFMYQFDDSWSIVSWLSIKFDHKGDYLVQRWMEGNFVYFTHWTVFANLEGITAT